MKNLFFIILSLSFFSIDAQVTIGDEIGTASDKTSVLLEFSQAESRGIILPYVRNKSNINTQGTLILDSSAPTQARVKLYVGTSSANPDGWFDFSGRNANVTSTLSSQPTSSGDTTAKVIIGDKSNAPDGVLVLNSTTKAMVLPTVNDYREIINPSPGMMVYINKTGYKRLAFYNGSVWTFWQP